MEEFEVDRSLFGNERDWHVRDVYVDEELSQQSRSHVTGRGIVMTVMAMIIIVIGVLVWNVYLIIR